MPRSKQGLVWRMVEKEKAREKAAKGPVSLGTWTVGTGNANTITINGTPVGTAMTDWKDFIYTTSNTSSPTFSIEWTDSGLVGSVTLNK